MDQRPVVYPAEVQRKNWPNPKKNIVLTVENEGRKIPSRKIDDYVKHIFTKHNQEADHWANLGGRGTEKIYC